MKVIGDNNLMFQIPSGIPESTITASNEFISVIVSLDEANHINIWSEDISEQKFQAYTIQVFDAVTQNGVDANYYDCTNTAATYFHASMPMFLGEKLITTPADSALTLISSKGLTVVSGNDLSINLGEDVDGMHYAVLYQGCVTKKLFMSIPLYNYDTTVYPMGDSLKKVLVKIHNPDLRKIYIETIYVERNVDLAVDPT